MLDLPHRTSSLLQRELPLETVEMLMRRGQEMLGLGDLSAARLLFGRAAEAGSMEAMLAMGRSYDPVVLAVTHSLAGADPAEAGRWYGRAAASGSKEAAALLQRLTAAAAR